MINLISLLIFISFTNLIICDLKNNDFANQCTIYNYDQRTSDVGIQDWGMQAYYPNLPQIIYSNYVNNVDQRDMYVMRSQNFPDLIPSGLCLVDIQGSCLVQPIDNLLAATYALGFNYFQSYSQAQTIQISVIDQDQNAIDRKILPGSPIVFNLKNQLYWYKKVLFAPTATVNVAVVICDPNPQGYTTITGIHLRLWIQPLCDASLQDSVLSTYHILICIPKTVNSGSINCYQFATISPGNFQCGRCDQQDDYTLINLANYKACIKKDNINYDKNCGLYQYTSDFRCSKCKFTGDSTLYDSVAVSINSQIILKCPQSVSWIQQYCTQYVYLYTGELSCSVCPYNLLPGTNGIKVCVRYPISSCQVYKPDTTCDPCASGLASYTITDKNGNKVQQFCPRNATSVLPNCLRASKIMGEYYCIACLKDYTLSFDGKCAFQNGFCAGYNRQNICNQCISGYLLKNGICYKPTENCLYYNSRGLCETCIQDFQLNNNNTCTKYRNIICNQNQFQKNGICIDGNIPYCIKYISVSGQCQTCADKYKVNQFKRCSLVCPQNTKYEQWQQKNGECLKKDLTCKSAHPNGYCYQCVQEYYQWMGKCYQIPKFTSTASTTSSTQQLRTRFLEQTKSNY